MQTHKRKTLILDTHIWLWHINGDKKLKNTRLEEMIEKSLQEKSLLLSIISIWEFGMLVSKKRLPITLSPDEWIEFQLEKSSITITELTPKIALQSCALPGDFHGDPFDRIIMATALQHQAMLATEDKKILDYAAKEMIPTISL